MSNGEQNDENVSTIGRRSYMKVAAGAIASLGAAGTANGATTTDAGYGAAGYGAGGYGIGRESESSTGTPPSVGWVLAWERSPPNPHATVNVSWSVSDDDGDLESVAVEVFDGERLVDSATTSVEGSSGSRENDFEIKNGAGETYEVVVRATDARGNASSERTTVDA